MLKVNKKDQNDARRRSCGLIVIFEHILNLALMFLLLTLNM